MTKKKRNKGLTKPEQRALDQKICELIGKNYNHDEIMLKLNLQPHVFRIARQRILDTAKLWLSQLTPEIVFKEYARLSLETIQMLDVLLFEMNKETRTQTAIVHAIRLRGKIVRSVVTLARQLGLISRRTCQIAVGGVMFSFTGNMNADYQRPPTPHQHTKAYIFRENRA